MALANVSYLPNVTSFSVCKCKCMPRGSLDPTRAHRLPSREQSRCFTLGLLFSQFFLAFFMQMSGRGKWASPASPEQTFSIQTSTHTLYISQMYKPFCRLQSNKRQHKLSNSGTSSIQSNKVYFPEIVLVL